MDPSNRDYYQSNLDRYLEKLTTLDEEYKEVINEAATDTLVFGDRFPFRYLMHDYHINYYAAFDGCSAETEASFSTIVFLVGKVDELGLGHIMVIDGSDFAIAETIRDATQAGDQEVLMLDSMQSVTSSDVAEGVTFISIMESNLEVLRLALN
jgi:zinc transport system substrate-binding protein